ncbi:MAG TPA: CsiV family protein [Spongiibacteraceae bacterium]|nr:CsiV family protein [Spongiibacteraceae bacterium]
MKKIIGLLAFALLLNATAQAQTLYQVELIAFARSGAGVEHEENWDRKYDLRYPERYVALQTADGSDAPFQQLGVDAMQLNKEADAIASRRNWRVLLHTAWRQNVDDPAHATPVIISGGKLFGLHHELEGTFTLSIERFLRADVDLWLSRFSNDPTALSAQILPNPPGTIAATATDITPYVVTRTVVMQQRRRLRSGELHYFDHPLLGLLVLVTPVTPVTTNAQ